MTRFSILIPTFNRAQSLRETLKTLEGIKYPRRNFEVIVIDNNSSDETAQVVRQFIKKTSLKVKYAFAKQQGRTFASLQGFRRAQFETIIFVDDDIAIKPNLLQRYDYFYQKYPQSVMIGGPIVARFPDEVLKGTFLARWALVHCPWVLGEIKLGSRVTFLKYPHILFAGNFSLNRTAFQRDSEIFSPLLGRPFGQGYLYAEDYELCLRLLLEKQKILYVPELNVENVIEPSRLTWNYLWKRHWVAGIERYIADQALRRYSSHKPYSASFWAVVKGIVGRGSSFEQRLQGVFELAKWWGYHFHGSRILAQLISENERAAP